MTQTPVAGEHLDDAAEQAPEQPVAETSAGESASGTAFSVTVGSFEGPFDLLLQLISKHKLEVTELALHVVTDEFIAHLRAQGPEWDLDETTEFLVVAATLLDLKAARLLPSGEVEDEEDLALLEARDLLFARLLQYRAYKEVSALFADRMANAARQVPRTVGLEPHFADLLPEVVLGLGPDAFAALAAKALTPRVEPEVSVSHLHVPLVSVREQAAIIVGRLRRQRTATFRALVSDAGTTMVVIGRFLALLELFREGSVSFEQVAPLGDLTIRWTGSDDGDVQVRDEYDDYDDEAGATEVEEVDVVEEVIDGDGAVEAVIVDIEESTP